MATAIGSDFALGMAARSSALIADDVAADELYRGADKRPGRTRMAAYLARPLELRRMVAPPEPAGRRPDAVTGRP